MARTGRRARALRALLEQAGLRPAAAAPPRPDGASRVAELCELHRSLGGVGERPAFKPGPWDLAFGDGLLVELDEELHFNRYRALTLQTSWSHGLPWTQAYQAHCAQREEECLHAGRWGRRWSSPSAARMFNGGPPGDLDGAGAARWKQRALYDAVKDTIVADDSGLVLARVSIWDPLDGGPLLGEALDGVAVEPRAVLELVERRRAPA